MYVYHINCFGSNVTDLDLSLSVRKPTIWVENQQFGFQQGLTQTGLYSHKRFLEAGNFGLRKKRNCTIRVAKTKALISFAVTAKLICAFVFRLCRLLVFPCGSSYVVVFGFVK